MKRAALALLLLPLILIAAGCDVGLDARTPAFTAVIERPIYGYYALSAGSQPGQTTALFLINTHSGEVTLLDQVPFTFQAIGSPRWNPDHTRIAYDRGDQLALMDPFARPPRRDLLFFDTVGAVYAVQGWGPAPPDEAEGRLLGIAAPGDTSESRLQALDLASGALDTLATFERGGPIPGAPGLRVEALEGAWWNPAREEWLLLNLRASSDVRAAPTGIALLFDARTGEGALLNRAGATGTPESLAALGWSPDGAQIALTALDERTIRLVNAEESPEGPRFTTAAEAPRTEAVLGWLGADDLLLTQKVAPGGGERLYSIGRIVEGELRTLPFFRLIPGQPDALAVGGGGFYPALAPEEKAALLALFANESQSIGGP